MIAALVKEEIPGGGWNYANRRAHASFVTAPVVQALLLAHSQGEKVPDEVIARARKALEESRTKEGSFLYSGTLVNNEKAAKSKINLLPGSIARSAVCETTLMLLGGGSVEAVRASVAAFHKHWDELEKRRQKPGTHIGDYAIAPYFFYYGHRYCAQAIELLPEKERPTERKKLLDLILKTRDADGTWNDRVFPRSRGYCSAMVVLALMGDKTPTPPAYQKQAEEGGDALHEAARLGDVKKVKELLGKGADVNARNRFGATPLWYAAYKNHSEVIKLLLGHKADPNVADNAWEVTPLALAAGQDTTDAAKLLLAAKAKGANDVFLTAATQGKVDLVASVLEHQPPSAEVLSTALTVTPATRKEVREALTKAGAKPFPPASAEELKQWKALEGTYENPNGRQLMVRMRDGVLFAGGGGRSNPSVARPVEKLTFRLVGDDPTKLRFEMKDGKVARVLLGEMAYEPRSEAVAEAKPGPYKDEPAEVRVAKNWPSFRGPGATGVADGQHPPGAWDLKSLGATSWKTAIPGLGHSCPVVWGDRVFVSTAVSSDPKSELKPGMYGAGTAAKDRSKHAFKVYCLDKKSGKILWEKTAYEGVPKIKRHIKATHANATPATDGRHVVVSFASEGLYCYDVDGNLLWKQDLGVIDAGAFNDPEIQWEAASSPTIWRDLVFLQCDRQKDSYITAFRIDTGKPVWRTARDEPPSWGTPTVVESKAGAELVVNGTTAIRGYDPLTGKELWRLGRNSQITVPTPFVGDGLIYVTSGYAPIQPIYAIWPGGRGDLTLKADRESSEQIAWSKTRGGPYMPTPIYYGGYLYVCSNAGQLACYEGRTGKQVYRAKLGGNLGYSASPVAADGKLYFTGEDGKVSVVAAGPTYQLLAVNELGETCLASPAISDGRIFCRTQGHVYGLARK